MAFENRLTAQEILSRKEATLKVVDQTCQYRPWGDMIAQVILFGSLSRNSGYPSSDADVVFWTGGSIPAINDYKDLSALLIQTVNDCREIYNAPFIINPFLVFASWYEHGSKPYLRKEVLDAIKNGVSIWSK